MLRKCSHARVRPTRDSLKNISGSRQPGLDSRFFRMYRATHHSTYAGYETRVIAHGDDASRSADNVHYVTRARAGPNGVPVRIESSDGNGNSSAQAELRGPLRSESAGKLIARSIAAVEFAANPCKKRIDRCQKIFARQAAQRFIPHPLVAHGANRARCFVEISDATESGGRHIAMFKCAGELRAFCRVVAQPMEQFGKAPLGGICPAAPIDSFQLFAASRFRDQCGFAPRSMVAP